MATKKEFLKHIIKKAAKVAHTYKDQIISAALTSAGADPIQADHAVMSLKHAEDMVKTKLSEDNLGELSNDLLTRYVDASRTNFKPLGDLESAHRILRKQKQGLAHAEKKLGTYVKPPTEAKTNPFALKEDAPTNSVGAGNIAGVGVSNPSKPSNWGEPGVSPKNQRRHTVLRRKKPPISESTDDKDEYVYHGTDQSRLESIKQHGLRPSEHGNPLNFHEDKDTISYYAGPDGVHLRVHKSNLPKDIKYQSDTGHYWTKQSVPPHHIEMKQGDSWKPLTSLEEDVDGGPDQLLPPKFQRGKFAGHTTFIVPSHIFHEARLQKRHYGRWMKYLGEEESIHEIRVYANKNPKKAIILQDERTGAMMYCRYSSKQKWGRKN